MLTSILQRLIIWISVLVLSACTSMQQVAFEPPPEKPKLAIGDHLIVYEKSGRIIDMELVSFEQGILKGALSANKLQAVEVNLADVERVDVESVDGGTTTLAVVGSILLLPIVIVAAFFGIVMGVEESVQ